MKHGRKYLFNVLQMAGVIFMISACGGGGGGSSGFAVLPQINPPATNEPPVAADRRLEAQTTSGDGKITMILQPDVVVIADEAQTAPSNALTFVFTNSSPPISTGAPFTWKDRAYVATSVEILSDGTKRVTHRPAEIKEVLKDLRVEGTIRTADLDPSSAALALAEGVMQNTETQRAGLQRNSPQQITVPQSATKSGCSLETAGSNSGDSLTCIVSAPSKNGFQFQGNIGFRDFQFSGLTVGLSEAAKAGDLQVTPFVGLDFMVTGENASSPELKGDYTAFRFQVAVAKTLNFVQLQMPVGISYNLPFVKLGAGFEAQLPYKAGKLGSPVYSASLPIVTTSSDLPFKIGLDDAFAGVKSGVEIVLVKIPRLLPSVFAWGEQMDSERLASAGVFYKAGIRGSLSAELRTSNSKPCLSYDVQGAAGISGSLVILPDSSIPPDFEAEALIPIGPRSAGTDGDCGSSEFPAEGFWIGSAEVTSCSRSDTVCNFLSYHVNAPGPVAINFRTGGEDRNLRIDQAHGCLSASTSISPQAGSSFSYSMSSSRPFAEASASTTKFNVITATDSEMTGTVEITFNNNPYFGEGGQGVAKGIWSAKRRANSFPKCSLPYSSHEFAWNTPSFFCPRSTGYCDFEYAQLGILGDWHTFVPGRPGEWQGQ